MTFYRGWCPLKGHHAAASRSTCAVFSALPKSQRSSACACALCANLRQRPAPKISEPEMSKGKARDEPKMSKGLGERPAQLPAAWGAIIALLPPARGTSEVSSSSSSEDESVRSGRSVRSMGEPALPCLLELPSPTILWQSAAFPFDDAVLETQAARVNGASSKQASLRASLRKAGKQASLRKAGKQASLRKAGKQASQASKQASSCPASRPGGRRDLQA